MASSIDLRILKPLLSRPIVLSGLLLFSYTGCVDTNTALLLSAAVIRQSLAKGGIWWSRLTFICTALCTILLFEALTTPVDLILAQYRIEGLRGTIRLSLSVVSASVILLRLFAYKNQPGGAKLNHRQDAENSRGAASIGLAFGMAISLFILIWFSSRTAQYALTLAHERVGNEYNLSLVALTESFDLHQIKYSALVRAWNQREIRDVTVSWVDQ